MHQVGVSFDLYYDAQKHKIKKKKKVTYSLVTFQVSLLTKTLCVFCFASLLAPYMVHNTFLSVFFKYATN